MENRTKINQNRASRGPGGALGGAQGSKTDFGWILGANMRPSWVQVEAKLTSNRIHSGMVFRSSFWIGCQSILGWILKTFWDPKWSPRVNLRQEVQNL